MITIEWHLQKYQQQQQQTIKQQQTTILNKLIIPNRKFTLGVIVISIFISV